MVTPQTLNSYPGKFKAPLRQVNYLGSFYPRNQDNHRDPYGFKDSITYSQARHLQFHKSMHPFGYNQEPSKMFRTSATTAGPRTVDGRQRITRHSYVGHGIH